MIRRRVDLAAAMAIVVANMIGTGLFTSLGYQLIETPAGFPVLLIWLLGGLLAFLGAVCYAEIATRLPESGGEYHYLSESYHPALGFMAGFTSATVGFAAPIAAAALAFAGYLGGLWPDLPEKTIATAVIAALSALHALHFRAGLAFQKLATALKAGVIVLFVIAGFRVAAPRPVSFNPLDFTAAEIWNPGLAVNLVWVSFAYSGWNASSYLAGEIADPARNLSRSLLYGTGAVIVLYLALNAVFMRVAPVESLRGVKEVGLVAAEQIFGAGGGHLMGGAISLLLLSSISSMILAGPRVIQALSATVPLLRELSVTDPAGNPVRAIAFQATLAILFLQTLRFDTLLYYTAFTLSLFTVLTVAGLFVLRRRLGAPEGYRAWGYPWSPLTFVLGTLGVGGFFVASHPLESLAGFVTALLGLWLYRASDRAK
ncbi:MAG: amino acid permease [Phycisphaerae bacterium]|nr:amino acid permease [Phycisphaerae bacterium]